MGDRIGKIINDRQGSINVPTAFFLPLMVLVAAFSIKVPNLSMIRIQRVAGLGAAAMRQPFSRPCPMAPCNGSNTQASNAEALVP